MATSSGSRRRHRKKIISKSDGSLYDLSERRRISHAELRDHVRDGGLFEARRHDRSGEDCTYEVLHGVMGEGVLENLVPGLGGGPLSGLGGLGGLPGGSGGLGGLAGLARLARLVGDGSGNRDWDRRDAWEDPPRRSSRRESDRGRDDWADAPGPSRPREIESWEGSEEPAPGPTRRDYQEWTEPHDD